jgi:hypothetical protein
MPVESYSEISTGTRLHANSSTQRTTLIIHRLVTSSLLPPIQGTPFARGHRRQSLQSLLGRNRPGRVSDRQPSAGWSAEDLSELLCLGTKRNEAGAGPRSSSEIFTQSATCRRRPNLNTVPDTSQSQQSNSLVPSQKASLATAAAAIPSSPHKKPLLQRQPQPHARTHAAFRQSILGRTSIGADRPHPSHFSRPVRPR